MVQAIENEATRIVQEIPQNLDSSELLTSKVPDVTVLALGAITAESITVDTETDVPVAEFQSGI